MSARLSRSLRRRAAERRRVDEFLAAIRATAPVPEVETTRPIRLPRVEPLTTPLGTVWRLVEPEPPTNALPLSLVRLMVRP